MSWRLYFRGLQPEQLAGTFTREGRMVDKRGLRQMRTVSKLVLEQSIRNSPVDVGGLEDSHRIEESVNGRRIEATVTVGGTTNSAGRDVDLYAVWLHESFDWNLGPKSKAKMMSSAKNKVGPLFLERALAEYESEFETLLDEAMQGLMQ